MRLKIKTRKSAAKRVNVKKRVIERKASSLGHLRRKKNAKRKRALKAAKSIHANDASAFKYLLPYLI